MIRIRYKDRKTVFVVTGVKKKDAAAHARDHHALWGREQTKVDGQVVGREISKADMIVEWQDGDVWKDDSPVEVIPVP